MQINFKWKTIAITRKLEKELINFLFLYFFNIKVFHNHTLFAVYFEKKKKTLELENSRSHWFFPK